MRTIRISDEDYEFLKDLQHELNTQENDGEADPIFWGVMETERVLAMPGEGDPYITNDDGAWTLEEAVEYVNDYIHEYDQQSQDEWQVIDKEDADDVAWFMKNHMDVRPAEVWWQREKEVISRWTGAFLTKRECRRYVETYGYNHCKPHTYAMTATRNFEYERLLRILKTMDIK